MSAAPFERDTLLIACFVINSALHHLRGHTKAAEQARQAAASAQHMLTRGGDAASIEATRELLAEGIAPLATAGFDLRRLYTIATVGSLTGIPLDAKQARVLGEALSFAFQYALDGLYHLDARVRRSRAVIDADRAFHDAETLIRREANEDWPALCRRLTALDVTLDDLGRLGIILISLGFRRDDATPRERRRARDRRRKAGRANNSVASNAEPGRERPGE
jgi:hypothetical protein